MWTIARGSPRPFLLSRAAHCHLARELDPQTGVQHVCLDIDVGASSIGCMAYRIGYPGVKVRRHSLAPKLLFAAFSWSCL